MSTDRPASSAARPPRLVPLMLTRWPRHTLAVAPHRKRAGPSGALPSLSRIDATGFGDVFIEPDEVTQCHRIGHVVGFGERGESQRLLDTRDEDRDVERAGPRVEHGQLIGQWRRTL